MKLFLKHIARTVRRSPIQPLLILFTVILSTAVAVTAFRMLFLFEDITTQSAKDESAFGDMIVSMHGDSDVRLLFYDDVESTLGKDISVQSFGEYSFTAFYQTQDGTKALSVSGANLEQADAYFRFPFLEYGTFTEQNLRSSAVISASMAKEYGLGVGSTLTLSVMGEDVTYTVQAVVRDEGLFSQRDVLISIDGLISVLAKENPLIAAIGSQAQPYNRICLRLENKADVSIALQRLSAAEVFSDKQISLNDRIERDDFMVFTQRAAMTLMAVVVLFLCALLVATCLQLLQEQRSAESALFYSIGAGKRHLHLLQYTESGIYALLGALGGIAFSYPLINGAWRLFDMPQAQIELSILDILFGFFFSTFLMLGCTAICLQRKKRMTVAEWLQKEEHTQIRASERAGGVLFIILWALCILLMFVTPLHDRYIVGIIAILLTGMVMYITVPMLLKQCSKIGEWLCSRIANPHAAWLLAQKNIREQHTLRNAGRLISVLMAVLILVISSSSMLRKQIDRLEHAFIGDMIAVNAGEELQNTLENDPRIRSVARFDMITTAVIADEYAVMAVMASGELDSILHSEFIPQRMPQKHEAVISKGIAMLADADVGEEFSVEIDGVFYTFTVSEIQNVHANFIFLNREAVPSTRDLLGISFSEGEGETKKEIAQSLCHLLEGQGVVLLSPETLRPSSYRLLLGFSNLLRYAMVAAVLVSLSGCFNLLFGQYRARKRERELLCVCGMTRIGIVRMYAAELLSMALPVMILGTLGGFVMSLLMNYGLHSFGISLFFF